MKDDNKPLASITPTPYKEIPPNTSVGFRDISGVLPTLSAAPAGTPRGVFQQIRIVRTAGTTYLYIYDTSVSTWYKVALS